MKVGFYLPGPGGTGYNRILRPAALLCRRGYSTTVVSQPDPDLLASFDVLILQRLFASSGIPVLRALRGKVPMIMDIEDHFMDFPSYNPAAQEYYDPDRRADIREALSLVDAVSVTTEAAVEHYRAYNRRVYLIGNSMDLAEFPAPDLDRPRSGGARLAWLGSTSRAPELELLRDVLPGVLASHPEARLYCTADPPFPIPGAVRVGADEYLDFYADMAGLGLDFGINPMRDNEFNRLCSPGKVLEYMALGLPVIGSDVGEHRRMIRHGENGFLASSEDDWRRRIEELIGDEGLCRKLGRAARRTVQTDYRFSDRLCDYERMILDVCRRRWGHPWRVFRSEVLGAFGDLEERSPLHDAHRAVPALAPEPRPLR